VRFLWGVEYDSRGNVKTDDTLGMRQCGEAALKKWDMELNKYYNLLMKILDKDAKKRLKESHLAWLKFRDLEFGFIEEGYFLDIGSYIGPTKVSNKVDIVKARALELKAYYDTIMGGQLNN
jgi:uncharacterized protein YecT (DUF1311 family)